MNFLGYLKQSLSKLKFPKLGLPKLGLSKLGLSKLGLFGPALPAKPIKGKEEIKKKYNTWRLRTFFGIYLGYAFFYLTRKSFTFAMPLMLSDLGLDKCQLGILGSILAISYGVSKFFSGMMSDRSNARFFMSTGLMLTGVFNILFGASSSLLLFALFWGLNGWFQGWGAPPCARLLTHWYAKSERGTWWSLWNTSLNFGGCMAPLVVSYIASHFGWRSAMYLPGIICIIMGLFIIFQLRDTPQSIGLPSIEKFKNECLPEREKNNLPLKNILIDYVFKNKYIWILSIAYFFIYMIRTAINDWTALYLIESKGFAILAAGSTIVFFEIGGAIGSLFAGVLSDRMFNGKRGPVNIIFIFMTIIALVAMVRMPGGSLLLEALLMFTLGFFLFGPQMLIGVTAVELAHKKVAGTVNGFLGVFACLGMAAAGGPLGAIIRDHGWNGYFSFVVACSLFAFCFLVPLWNVGVTAKPVEKAA